MNRRHLLSSLLSFGALSFFGRGLLTRDKVIYCKIEDFWETVKYEEEWEDGMLQRNVYRVEDYPTCSVFKKIKFKRLKNGDHFIFIISNLDYMGPGYGYGFISRAECDSFVSANTYGVKMVNIKVERCWTPDAFEKHMIKTCGHYSSPSGEYVNGVRVG